MPQPRVEEFGLTMLRKGHVIVSGVAGRGKTALAKQLMVRLCKEENYLPVKIHDPSEWKNCISCKEKCVVFIDDFIGRSNLNKVEFDSWEKFFDEMVSYAKSGRIRIIIGMRNTILQEAGGILKRHKLFVSQYHLDLSIEKNELTREEKSELLKHFCQAFDVFVHDKEVIMVNEKNRSQKHKPKIITRETLDDIAQKNPLIGFPQACFVFFSDESMFGLGVDYFVHADQRLKDEVRQLRRNNPLRYLLLAYALLENRKIDTEQLNTKKLKTLCKKLNQKCPEKVDIEDELDEMKLSYMTYTEGTYEFRHETYVEAVLCSFGVCYAKYFLANAHEEIIKEFVRSSGYQPNPGEICVCLPQDMTGELAPRILNLTGAFPTTLFEMLGSSLVISELKIMNDPEFSKEIISIFKTRPLRRSDIGYMRLCFQSACTYDRHSFVHEILSNFDVDITGHRLQFDNRQKRSKTEQKLPISEFYITRSDLEYGIVSALQYGCLGVLETIFTCTHYNINNKLGHLTISTILQSKMEGMTPVIYASYARCKPSVEYLIGKKAELELTKTDSYGCTALHYCIVAGWVDIVERMLSIQGKLIRQESHSGVNPLGLSLALGNEAVYNKLVEILHLEEDFISRKACIETIFSGVMHCHDMYSYHFCALGFPIYIRDNKLSKEENFLSLLRRIPEEKLSSMICSTNMDKFENKLPHFCVINRLSKIFKFIKEKYPCALQLRNKSKLPTCLHLGVFIGRSEVTATLLQMKDAGLRPTDLALADVLKYGRELTKTLPQDKMTYEYLFLKEETDNEFLKRVTGIDYGIPVRFGDQEEYDEIELLLK